MAGTSAFNAPHCAGVAARQSTGPASNKDIPNSSERPSSKSVAGNTPGPQARVLGKDKGGTERAPSPNDPFGYVKLGPDHAYLGHFRQEKFLEEGHNTKRNKAMPAPGAPAMSTPMPPPAGSNAGRAAARRQAFATEHPVIMAQRAARKDIRSAKLGVKLARVTGGDVGAARAAVATAKAARKTNVAAAIANPESARSERTARVAAKTAARKTATAARLRRKISRIGGTYSS